MLDVFFQKFLYSRFFAALSVGFITVFAVVEE